MCLLQVAKQSCTVHQKAASCCVYHCSGSLLCSVHLRVSCPPSLAVYPLCPAPHIGDHLLVPPSRNLAPALQVLPTPLLQVARQTLLPSRSPLGLGSSTSACGHASPAHGGALSWQQHLIPCVCPCCRQPSRSLLPSRRQPCPGSSTSACSVSLLQVAEQIRAAQQKAALSGQAPAAWAIGARCEALYAGDGQWYSATVKGVTGAGNFLVSFDEYGIEEEVGLLLVFVLHMPSSPCCQARTFRRLHGTPCCVAAGSALCVMCYSLAGLCVTAIIR